MCFKGIPKDRIPLRERPFKLLLYCIYSPRNLLHKECIDIFLCVFFEFPDDLLHFFETHSEVKKPSSLGQADEGGLILLWLLLKPKKSTDHYFQYIRKH